MQRRLALPVIDVACIAGVKTTALDDAGTVILYDIEHLRPADQYRLLRWLEKAPRRLHIISTSSRQPIRWFAQVDSRKTCITG